MPAICDLALAVGLTLSGTCQPANPADDPLPINEPGAWSYKEPTPPPAPPAPPPVMPPVVIEKTIIKEVPAAAPPPVASAPIFEESDPWMEAAEASYRRRSAGPTAWPEITVSASLSSTSSITDASARPMLPAMPLDLGATVGGVKGTTAYREASITSTGPVDNSRIIGADRIITGNVENGTNSQLSGTTGGTIVIQVSRDVFGYHGRNILIPKGSRIICGYKSLEKIGSSRGEWRCGRLLAGGTRYEIFGMKSNVFDSQGNLGAIGDVDNRLMETYGTAGILAFISAGVRVATANAGGAASSSSSSSASGSSSTWRDGGAVSQGGAELADQFGQIGAAALERTVSLTPFLKTYQGQRVQIRPDTDWYIAQAE